MRSFGLLGPNGAGKTTTISMICGVLQPDGGRILVDESNIWVEPKKVKRTLGVVPQEIAVYEDLTARDNLSFWGSLYDLRGAELRNRIDEILSRVGLAERAGDKVKTFSGGMKRRLNLCMGLLHRPEFPPPRRTDGGHRPAGAAQYHRGHPGGGSRRDNGALHDPLHGRGRAALRPHRHHRSRQDPRPRHPGRADQARRRSRGAAAQRRLRRSRRRDGASPISRELRILGFDDGSAVLAIESDGPGLLEILPRVLEADLGIEDVSIQRPNLQSVFIALTGRELRD